MPTINDYDIELQKYVKVTKLGNIKLTPTVVRIANFLGKPTFLRIHRDADLIEEKHQIKGYNNTLLNVISYTPIGEEPIFPAILFFHGGAFMLNGFGHSRKFARMYAKSVNAKVFFVDYHLAFKYPYPYALEDAYLALKWVNENAVSLKIEPKRIAVCGDSAGGFIAAALAQLTQERKGPSIAFQMLIYPVIDANSKTTSMMQFDDTPGWNSKLNQQMCELYFKDPSSLEKYTKLLTMDCTNLPPAYIEAHEFDCLRDEAIQYANHLNEHGVDVILKVVKGSFHGADLFSKTEIVKELMNERFKLLVSVLHPNKIIKKK